MLYLAVFLFLVGEREILINAFPSLTNYLDTITDKKRLTLLQPLLFETARLCKLSEITDDVQLQFAAPDEPPSPEEQEELDLSHGRYYPDCPVLRKRNLYPRLEKTDTSTKPQGKHAWRAKRLQSAFNGPGETKEDPEGDSEEPFASCNKKNSKHAVLGPGTTSKTKMVVHDVLRDVQV
jgi:hypothetical protein